MDVILCSAMGYLLGTFNPAYILGRLRGFDIRGRGSGNAGATNVAMVMGKIAGVLCALLDILKAYAAYRLAKLFFPSLAFASALAGVCCIIGHIFPFWMNFAGGKGLACIGGVVLAYSWRWFIVLLTAEAILALAVNYICVVPLSISVVFPVLYGFTTRDLIGALLLAALIPVVFYKHIPNLQRIREGKEARMSWLWKPQEEEARLKDKYSETEWKKIYRKANEKE